VAPSVFKELGAEVVSLFVDPDGFNINAQCGSLYPQVLAQAVLAHQADLGIAFDGDGDRVIMVDHTGAIMDGDALLYIIACLYQEAYGIVGVVGTVMSNLGLELALKRRNLEFVRTAVGDRHVLAQLQERGWPIGGEPSGHVLCCDLNSTGDGIIVALQVLRVMREQHCALCDLWGDFQKYPQLIINVRTPYAHQLMGMASIQAAIHAAEQALMGTGRVVLRPSGTEPVIRIMVEGEDAAEVERITYALAQVVETAVL
jgi:phosphoglucosamine mutase